MSGALAGLQVVDCTHVIAGAYTTSILADLGADVVKIEPIGGEDQRHGNTFPFQPFDLINRNKRAIALDLHQPTAVDIVRRLATTADVFVENFRPGACDRLGLGYDDLKTFNPRLVYCSVSGFGHTGPYRDRPGYDLIAQAMSGVMSLTGPVGGTEPVAAGVPVCDFGAGLFGALGILAALQHRNSTGEGQKVEATLLESGLGFAVWEQGLFDTLGHVSGPMGSAHRLSAPYEALRTADSHIVVGVNNQRLWAAFCTAVGAQHLEHDERFSTQGQRLKHRVALKQELEALLVARPTFEWQARLLAAGVPAGPVNTIAEALADPQIASRGLLTEVDGQRFTRVPVTLTATPAAIRRGKPAVGEHTTEVLAALGMTIEEIEVLAEAGAIQRATHEEPA